MSLEVGGVIKLPGTLGALVHVVLLLVKMILEMLPEGGLVLATEFLLASAALQQILLPVEEA